MNLLALEPEFFTPTESSNVYHRAQRAIKQVTDLRLRDLVAGMQNYRQEDWTGTLRHLERLQSTPDNAWAALAGFFCAMAQWSNGQKIIASNSLSRAQRHIEIGLAPGTIGHKGQDDWVYLVRWADYARSLVVREQAERLIAGRVTSDPVTKDSLRQRREAWQSVQTLLDRAEEHGRKREWSEAAEAFAAAQAEAPINWEQHGNLVKALHIKAAAAFVLSDDLKNYRALAASFLDQDSLVGPEYSRPWLLATNGLSPSMINRARDEVYRIDAIASTNGPSDQVSGTTSLNVGLARLRDGDHEIALAAFERAAQEIDLNRAGVGEAFAAVAAWRLGRNAEAEQFLENAEEKHFRILAGNPTHLGRNWHHLAQMEIALGEARKLVEASSGDLRVRSSSSELKHQTP